jgi:hypothetical protein
VFAVAYVEVVTDILPDKLGYSLVKWKTHTYIDCLVEMDYEGHGESDGGAVFTLDGCCFGCRFAAVPDNTSPPGSCSVANNCVIETCTGCE